MKTIYMKPQNMHRIIMAIPGLFVVIALFLSRQIELGLLLLVFDIIGAIGGIWWLSFSKKLAHRMHSALQKKDGKITIKPVMIVFVIVAIVVSIAAVWMLASVIRVVTGATTLDPRCIVAISDEKWVEYATCLRDGLNCTNPINVCRIVG